MPPPPVLDAASVRLIPAGTSFPSRAGAACSGTNAVSPRRILLLFIIRQDRPFRAGAVAARLYAARGARLLARSAARERPIEVVRAGAGEGADDRCRRPGTRARLHQPAQRIDREREVRTLTAGRTRRRDHQHDLALHVLAESARELAERRPRHLLVQLGE